MSKLKDLLGGSKTCAIHGSSKYWLMLLGSGELIFMLRSISENIDFHAALNFRALATKVQGRKKVSLPS